MDRNLIMHNINTVKAKIDHYTGLLNIYNDTLNNYDLETHKKRTIEQFGVWKNEFVGKYQSKREYKVIKDLLDNCYIVDWQLHHKGENKLLLCFNNVLLIDWHIIKGQKEELYIWTTGKSCVIDICNSEQKVLEIEKLAREINLSIDNLFDILALTFHCFLFDFDDFSKEYSLLKEQPFLRRFSNPLGDPLGNPLGDPLGNFRFINNLTMSREDNTDIYDFKNLYN